MAYLTDDHPGALLEFLTEFAVRGVNLTLIQSRPTGDGFGRYRFWIDCEGHVADARVGEALMGLRRVCSDVRFLGSYPRADEVRPGDPAWHPRRRLHRGRRVAVGHPVRPRPVAIRRMPRDSRAARADRRCDRRHGYR